MKKYVRFKDLSPADKIAFLKEAKKRVLSGNSRLTLKDLKQ